MHTEISLETQQPEPADRSNSNDSRLFPVVAAQRASAVLLKPVQTLPYRTLAPRRLKHVTLFQSAAQRSVCMSQPRSEAKEGIAGPKNDRPQHRSQGETGGWRPCFMHSRLSLLQNCPGPWNGWRTLETTLVEANSPIPRARNAPVTCELGALFRLHFFRLPSCKIAHLHTCCNSIDVHKSVWLVLRTMNTSTRPVRPFGTYAYSNKGCPPLAHHA